MLNPQINTQITVQLQQQQLQQKIGELFKLIRNTQGKLTACLDKHSYTLPLSASALIHLATEMHQPSFDLQAQPARDPSASPQMIAGRRSTSATQELPADSNKRSTEKLHGKKSSISSWLQSNVLNKLAPLLTLQSHEERFKQLLYQYIEHCGKYEQVLDDAIKSRLSVERECQMLLRMFSQLALDFRRYVYIVIPPLRHLIIRCNEYLMFQSVTRRCHSMGALYQVIPDVALQSSVGQQAQVVMVEDTATGRMKIKQVSDTRIKRVQRHAIDDRYDYRVLHDIRKEYQKDGIDVTEVESQADGQKLMQFFVSFAEDTHFDSAGSLIAHQKKADDSDDVACQLTATYPFIKPSRLMDKEKRRQSAGPDADEPVLLNDPNADAYVLIETDNYVVGCVADGMGAGHHARIASNLLCALVLARVCGYDYQPNTDVKQTVPQFQSTAEVLKFLDDTILEAQRVMCEIEECGGTTLVLWVLSKVQQPTNDYTHVLNYVIAGDAEGYHHTCSIPNDAPTATPRSPTYPSVNSPDSDAKPHKNLSKKWVALQQYPLDSESIRLSTSYTPGGIGKHHGTADLLWGVFVNREYVKRNWKAWAASVAPQTPGSATVNEGGNTDSMEALASLTEFYSHSNNLHYGQVMCEQDDYLLFASDGLGDTLDPLQLYPRPYLIHGLESFQSWEQFQKEFEGVVPGYGTAMVSRQLKEMAINTVLSSTMTPYGIDSLVDSSLKLAFTPHKSDFLRMSSQKSLLKSPAVNHCVTAQQILIACVNHAMAATQGDRELYDDDQFLRSSRPDKQRVMEQRIEKFMVDKLPFRRHSSLPGASSLTSRTQSASILTSKSGRLVGMTGLPGDAVKFGLPTTFVPFAKIDHLGIEVVRVGALVTSQQ